MWFGWFIILQQSINLRTNTGSGLSNKGLPKLQAVHLLDELPQNAVPRLREFKLRERMQLLYAYSAPRHYHQVFLDALCDSFYPELGMMAHMEICCLVWALANFRYVVEGLHACREGCGCMQPACMGI
jgi:hypothetical protein